MIRHMYLVCWMALPVLGFGQHPPEKTGGQEVWRGGGATGEIRVYFNHWVEESLSNGAAPDGTNPNQLEAAILERIDAAQLSIDVAAYNLTRQNIMGALKAAHQRGVRVRLVYDDQQDNSALSPPPPFPILSDQGSEGLMHNKFLVIDAADPQNAWVITGSTNFTFNGVVNNFNNLVMVQDQALAQAYQLEFNEMWGSEGGTPNLSNARFGAEKTDNTPHFFTIGGHMVECWFSPSDFTTDAIRNALNSADHSIHFAVFSFTHDDLGTALIAAHQRGVFTKGIIEGIDDTGNEFNRLKNAGVWVQSHPQNFFVHHKYAIVDAQAPDSDPLVITGSHNWTYSAEFRNDENTLIFHDPDLANIFLQEFEARWQQITPTEQVPTPASFSVFPNPTPGPLHLQPPQPTPARLPWTLYDAHGRLLQGGILPNPVAGALLTRLDGLPSGTYFLSVRGEAVRVVKQ